jgi:chaperonin GroES
VKKPAKKAKASKKSAAKNSSKKTVKKAPAAKAAPKTPQVDYSKAITPLMDRLVVRVINSERLTAGGLLIIPDTALMATGYLKAEVLAVGTGIKSKRGYMKPLDVKIGDKVLFAEYAGTKVQFNSEDLHIIHESDVMGILEE